MDVERSLISKIISTGDIATPVIKGIKVEHFADEECQGMYKYLLAHAHRYADPPTIEAIKHDRPKWELLYPDDSLDYLIDKFVEMVKRRFGQDQALRLAELADDPDQSRDIEMRFFEVARDLARLVPTTESSRLSDMGMRVVEYERKKAEGKKTGIGFGFSLLDNWTGGIQPHEFATVAGFSGLGKSTFLIAVAHRMWIAGKSPLFISLEMEAAAIMRRFDAMTAKLNYWQLKHLDLPDVDVENWREIAAEIAQRECDISVIDSITHCTPEHVIAETTRHQPDVVFIDYLGLMKSTRQGKNMTVWQMIADVTRDLKQSCRELHIPIVAAAQTNRSGAKEGAELDNVAQSISISQDPDLVIGLHADDDMKARKRMQIKLIKNRDGKLGELMAVWDHDEMDFREETSHDIFTKPTPRKRPGGPLRSV